MANWQNISLNRKQTALAILLITIIIASLVLRLVFYDRAINFEAPDYIVSNNHVAAVAYDKHLYVLDQEGELIAKHPFSKAGIQDDIADMQLLDSNTIALADWGKEQIIKCDLLNLDCSPISIKFGKQLGHYFKFHYRTKQNDILLADTDRHRILQYDIQTQQARTISTKDQFIYPNHLQVESDGLLHITDTNHHQIKRFNILDDKLIAQGEAVQVPKTVSKNKWPIFYYRLDNGDMFVLQGNNLLRQPDLVFFEQGQSPRSIPTRYDSDITVLAKMENRLLMTDRQHFKVYALDLDTMSVSEFGNQAFQKALLAGKRQSENWLMMADKMLYLLIAAVVGIIAFIIILALSGERHPQKHSLNRSFSRSTSNSDFTATTAAKLPPIQSGTIFWLEQNPKFRLLFIALIVVITMSAALMLIMLDIAYKFSSDDVDMYEQLIYAAALFLMVLLLAALNAFLNLSCRIGTDGIHILFKQLGRIYKTDPKAVFYNNNYIQFANQTFVYRNNMQAYFHNKEQFEQYITPLLDKSAQKISHFGIIKNMFRHPNYITLLNAIIFTCITMTFLYFYFSEILSK